MGTGGVSTPPTKLCFVWPQPPSLDAGMDGSGGGGTGGSADAGPIDAGPCPTDFAEVLSIFLAENCPRGFEPGTIVSGPVPSTAGECCYETELAICGPGGRPYLVDERARVSAPERGAGTKGWSRGQGAALDGLTREERTALAEAWTADALLEHASVASFSRASLALLAAGAPAFLIELTHEAALDEVRHARLCFALAAAYAGEDVSPGPFPLGRDVRVAATLAEIAASTAREGCIGETIAAAVASEQLARATDPAVRAALEQIAADEARHAELGWRTVAWAVCAGGEEVRRAVEQVFGEALAAAPRVQSGGIVGSAAMEAHGRLDAAATAKVAAMAMAEIVAPCAAALLRAPRA
jgi:hypothetical protein